MGNGDAADAQAPKREHTTTPEMRDAACEHFAAGEYAAAAALWERAGTPRAAPATHLVLWAVALGQLGRYEQALEVLTIAAAGDPDDPAILMNKGVVLAALARPSEAISCYERAATVRPGHADTFYNWGNALQDLRLYEEAVAKYQVAERIRRGDADTSYRWAGALGELGRHEDAAARYMVADELRPDDVGELGHQPRHARTV